MPANPSPSGGGRGEGAAPGFARRALPLTADPGHLRRLSALLAMPEEGSLEVLRDMLAVAPWLASPLAELQQLPLAHWQAEHTRLFLNGYPKTFCPPFESAYRHSQMSGTTAGDLRALYLRAGLQPMEAPADYLGTLLEYAAYLRESDTMEDLLERLLREHLERWVPRFAGDLQAHARLRLYRGLGEQLAALFDE